ncbi:MAG: EAL domain-containing protein [Steroidobacterales bacterium]
MLSKDAAGHWNAGANAAAGLPAAAQAAELVRLAARLLRLKSRLKFGDVGLGQARAAHVPAATLNATGHGARQASARNEFDALQEFAVVLISEIQQAIDRDAFCYFYQPIVGASSGIVEGYEALMRWRRGAQTVAPALFLPIAEETGSLGTMQQRLLDDVAKAWVQLAPPAFVSINWSPRQFLKASAASALIDRVKELKIDPKRIVIEITARSTVIDPDLVYFCIVLLKETGFQIALDDFGGNYGSLSYLSRLPIDLIKLDGSLTADLGQSERAAETLAAVVDFAHKLGHRVVAKGVETPPQAAALRRLGCDFLQGHFIGSPARDLSDADRVIEFND